MGVCQLVRLYAVTLSQSSCSFALCIAWGPLRVIVHYQAHDLSSLDAELTQLLTASLCHPLHTDSCQNVWHEIVFLPIGPGVSERAFEVLCVEVQVPFLYFTPDKVSISASRWLVLACPSPLWEAVQSASVWRGHARATWRIITPFL
jgi:hypothetical protein